MKVATASQTVEVTGQVPVLNTAESRNQMTLATSALSSLPLAGRNMVSLVTLAPGVIGIGTVTGGSPGSGVDNYSTELQVDASANGAGSVGNMYMVDGLDVTSAIRPGVLNLTPNPDSVQEVSIQTNTFSVEYGRASSDPDGHDHEIRHRRLPWHRERLLHRPKAVGRDGVRSQILSVPQQQRLRYHRRADYSAPPVLFLLRHRALPRFHVYREQHSDLRGSAVHELGQAELPEHAGHQDPE